MTIAHRLKIQFAKIRWYFSVRKKRREALKRIERVQKLRKETEMMYNEGYRKNPTHHDVLKNEGKLEAYSEILDD